MRLQQSSIKLNKQSQGSHIFSEKKCLTFAWLSNFFPDHTLKPSYKCILKEIPRLHSNILNKEVLENYKQLESNYEKKSVILVYTFNSGTKLRKKLY